MKSSSRKFVTLAAIFALISLSGCLESESDPQLDSTNAGTNTPGTGTNTPPPSNSPPTISGSPSSAVTVDEAYSFVPTASDPDGDALTFEIRNKPGWASFNTGTGEISGTPTIAHVGIYSNISISVTDGQASATTPGFSVEVSQVQLGSVTLSWTAPTQNSDGSALSDLAGYKIYYGTSEGIYPHKISIDTSGTTTYVVENLAPDTYFFVATAVNSKGMESDFSAPAQIAVN